MKNKIQQIIIIQIYVFCFIIQPEKISAQSPTDQFSDKNNIVAVVDITKISEPIHPYVYGMFTELLGNIFEHGLWAEMLSDRKFFYSVDTATYLNPVNTRRFQNRWRPVGGTDVVKMDHEKPFVGEHTPLIKLDGKESLGIKQAGMGFKKGRKYTGYIILSGENGVNVMVSLIWGPEKKERQTITITNLTNEYNKYTFRFIAGNDADDGILEIKGTGNGYIKIGAVSLMPADNMKGYRADIISLLKDLNSGVYRWPGGNMVAGYDWRDGIGDPDKRPPRYDYAWNAVESNDVGTDEYMDLCELLDIDPYICVNIGFGDEYSAAQWVEYVNGDEKTLMGKLRAQNGHPEPYKVEWWGIGNEMYGQWQLGHMSVNHYILKHNLFAKAMRKVDPSIKLIASGATPFETSTTARHHRFPLPAKLPYEYGSPEDWTGNLLAQSADYIDFMAEHLYPLTDHAFNIDSQKFIQVDDPIVDQVRRVPNRIKAVAEAWDEYLKRMPGLDERQITFAIDEWTGGGWSSGFVRTLCAAEGLQEIFRHSDIITMGGYTAVTSCVNFNATDACLSSIGLVFKLYRQHFGTIPVEVTGNSPQHPVKGTVGVDKPAVSSGSDTWPLDVIASLTDDQKKLTLAVVNPTEFVQYCELNILGTTVENRVKVYNIVAPALDSRNIPGSEPVIFIQESEINNFSKTISVQPLSISLYKFDI